MPGLCLLLIQTVAAAPVGDRIWVEIPDGALQCEPKSGIKPERAKAKLNKKGVVVFQFKQESDGQMHMTLCGTPTGGMLKFEIRARDLKKAQSLGYKVTASGSQGGSVGGTASRSG